MEILNIEFLLFKGYENNFNFQKVNSKVLFTVKAKTCVWERL